MIRSRRDGPSSVNVDVWHQQAERRVYDQIGALSCGRSRVRSVSGHFIPHGVAFYNPRRALLRSGRAPTPLHNFFRLTLIPTSWCGRTGFPRSSSSGSRGSSYPRNPHKMPYEVRPSLSRCEVLLAKAPRRMSPQERWASHDASSGRSSPRRSRIRGPEQCELGHLVASLVTAPPRRQRLPSGAGRSASRSLTWPALEQARDRPTSGCTADSRARPHDRAYAVYRTAFSSRYAIRISSTPCLSGTPVFLAFF